jgi:hypothetical protein
MDIWPSIAYRSRDAQRVQHPTTVRYSPTVFMCFVFIWEQTTCATYSINWLVIITQMESVYCAVRTGYLKSSLRLVYDKKCLQRGMDWVFKLSSLRLVYNEKCLERSTDWVFKWSSLRLVYDKKCLERGTDWVFKWSSLHSVFKGFTEHSFMLWLLHAILKIWFKRLDIQLMTL